MPVLLTALVWMLLLGLVVGLCRAARLGDGVEHAPSAAARAPVQGGRAAVGSSGLAHREDVARLRAKRRHAQQPGHRAGASFTKSLRRRAGLHRA
jgi:hypothetical protein